MNQRKIAQIVSHQLSISARKVFFLFCVIVCGITTWIFVSNLQYVGIVKNFCSSILRERELTFSEILIQRDLEKYIGSKNQGSLISWHLIVLRDGNIIAEVGDKSQVHWSTSWLEKSSISNSPLKIILDMNFLSAILITLSLNFMVAGIFWLHVKVSNSKVQEVISDFTNKFSDVLLNIQLSVEQVQTSNNFRGMDFLKTTDQYQEIDLLSEKLILLLDMYSKQLKAIIAYEVEIQVSQQVAHDIRSPLVALKMLLDYLPEIDEEKRKLYVHALERIDDISNDLNSKQKSKISLNKTSKLKDDLNELNEVVNLADLLQNIFAEKKLEYTNYSNIQLNLVMACSDCLTVNGNAKQISRVVSNLINNCVDSIPEGKLGKIDLEVIMSENSVQLLLSDNGKGIPENLLPMVGQRGFSAGKKDLQSGAGLGFFHAKSTVEKINGTLEIASKENSGTTVSITLPLARKPLAVQFSFLNSDQLPVVLIDDELLICESWKMMLEHQNVDLKFFLDPEEFFLVENTFARNTQIFLDLNIHGVQDGVDVARKIHSLGFVNINFSTNYLAEEIPKIDFIKSIISKEPPNLR